MVGDPRKEFRSDRPFDRIPASRNLGVSEIRAFCSSWEEEVCRKECYPGGSRNQRGSARRCNRFAGRIRSTNGLISDNYLPVNPHLRTSRPAALDGKAEGGKDGYRSYRALETSVTSRESGGRAEK